jgi:hypothetical protein
VVWLSARAHAGEAHPVFFVHLDGAVEAAVVESA